MENCFKSQKCTLLYLSKLIDFMNFIFFYVYTCHSADFKIVHTFFFNFGLKAVSFYLYLFKQPESKSFEPDVLEILNVEWLEKMTVRSKSVNETQDHTRLANDWVPSQTEPVQFDFDNTILTTFKTKQNYVILAHV